MLDGNVMGIDLAKSSFQIHIATKTGRVLSKLNKSRSRLKGFLATCEKSTIFMESCGSSHYWARKARSFGHDVKLIAPQYVKPFVKRQKNDAADAQAICEAGCRESMNFVPSKTVEQQDIQSIVRARDLLVGQRTALGNQIRGLLSEYGVVTRQGHKALKLLLAKIVSGDADQELLQDLTTITIDLMADLRERWLDLDVRIARFEKQIEIISKTNETCKRLRGIPGIGPITAVSLLAAIGNASDFKNSRQLSAWLGLVPRQNSTGGKTKLLGLSKQGNKQLRTLLIHGGRAVLINAGKKKDPRSQWADKLRAKVGMNKAAVAFANKNARTVWAILSRGEAYDPNYKGKGKNSPPVVIPPSVPIPINE